MTRLTSWQIPQGNRPERLIAPPHHMANHSPSNLPDDLRNSRDPSYPPEALRFLGNDAAVSCRAANEAVGRRYRHPVDCAAMQVYDGPILRLTTPSVLGSKSPAHGLEAADATVVAPRGYPQ